MDRTGLPNILFLANDLNVLQFIHISRNFSAEAHKLASMGCIHDKAVV